MTSQAEGAGNTAEVKALLVRALFVGLGAGVVILLMQAPLFWAAFQIAPASSEVESLATDYMRIRIFSAPAAIALYGITGWLIALERTRAVLLLQLWMNGLNIVLDLWFVLGLDWGVSGVAFATFLAEWSGCLLGIWICRDGLLGGILRDKARLFDSVILRKMLVVNGDIMIRSVLLQAAFMSFLFLGSGIDDATLAANQVLLQFLHITAYALDGFAFAAESLVGQALGARNRARLRRAALLTSVWGCVIVVGLSVGFLLFGGPLIDLMATASDVRIAARDYLVWVILAPLFGIASWMLDGIFIGATRTADMRKGMVISTLVYAGAVAILMPLMGNHGLWAALMIFFVARGVTLAVRYPALEASSES